MKKIYTFLAMAVMAVMLTSCQDDDEQMALTLHGIWRGTMYESYYNRYGEYLGGDAYYTMFRFEKRGNYEGVGTERDVDDWGNVVERDFDWEVNYNTIYLYYDDVYYYNGRRFLDRQYQAVIYNAALGERYFTGDMEDNAGIRRHFKMEYYSSPWGNSYYAPTRSSSEPVVATPELIDSLKIKKAD